jgi:hypothetical protein
VNSGMVWVAQAHVDDLRRNADRSRLVAEARRATPGKRTRRGPRALLAGLLARIWPVRQAQPVPEIRIRMADSDDRLGLLYLAFTSGSAVVPDPLLVAEQGGRLRAAASLSSEEALVDGSEIGDELLGLLRVRRRQLHGDKELAA